MRDKRTPEEARRELAGDIRSNAGYLEAVIAKAERLGIEVPEDVAQFVGRLRAWGWTLRGEEE